MEGTILMAVTVLTLIDSKQAEDEQTTQYTAPEATVTIIDKFTVHNTSANNINFSINLVGDGDLVGASNLMFSRTIAPDETYPCPEIVGQALEENDFISTIAGAVSSLTIRASGREIS